LAQADGLWAQYDDLMNKLQFSNACAICSCRRLNKYIDVTARGCWQKRTKARASENRLYTLYECVRMGRVIEPFIASTRPKFSAAGHPDRRLGFDSWMLWQDHAA
jgi:methionyl-tRNA synthetase